MKRLSIPAAWALALAGLFLVFAVARAQGLRLGAVPGGEAPETVRLYEGVSPRGEFQEALNAAVAKALGALPGADRMVRYRVREITGEQGGIAGANTLRVVIEVPHEGEPGLPGNPDGGDAPGPFSALRPTLGLSFTKVDQVEQVGLTLNVRNTSGETLVVPFSSGQKYDFEAWRDNRLVWRWSHGRVFTQALQQVRVRPGETLTYKETWNLRNNDGEKVPPGEYVIRAYPTIQGQRNRIVASERLTVTE